MKYVRQKTVRSEFVLRDGGGPPFFLVSRRKYLGVATTSQRRRVASTRTTPRYCVEKQRGITLIVDYPLQYVEVVRMAEKGSQHINHQHLSIINLETGYVHAHTILLPIMILGRAKSIIQTKVRTRMTKFSVPREQKRIDLSPNG